MSSSALDLFNKFFCGTTQSPAASPLLGAFRSPSPQFERRVLADIENKMKDIASIPYVLFQELTGMVRKVPKGEEARLQAIFTNIIEKTPASDYKKALNDEEYDLALFLLDKIKVKQSHFVKSLKEHYSQCSDRKRCYEFILQVLKHFPRALTPELREFIETVSIEMQLEVWTRPISMTLSQWCYLYRTAEGEELFTLKQTLSSQLIPIKLTDVKTQDLIDLLGYIAPKSTELERAMVRVEILDNPAAFLFEHFHSLHKPPCLALHHAVCNRDLNAVKFFLKLRAPLSAVDENGDYPLKTALLLNDVPMTKLLLEYGADVDLKDAAERTPLHHAAFVNNPQLIELLYAHDANLKVDGQYKTPYFIAVEGGCHEAFEKLNELYGVYKESSADAVIYENKAYVRGLIHYATLNKDLRMLQLVMNAGFSTRVLDEDSNTALHYAVSLNWEEGLKALLDYDPRLLNMKNGDEVAPIQIAIQKKLLGCVKELLNRKANLYVFGDFTVFHYAVLSTPEILKAILAKKRYVDTENKSNGKSPLMLLMENYHNEKVDLGAFSQKLSMIYRVAAMTRKDFAGITPLDRAMELIDNHAILETYVIKQLQGIINLAPDPVLYKPLERRYSFACQSIIPLYLKIVYPSIIADVPNMKNRLHSLLEYFPEKNNWNQWIDTEVETMKKGGKPSEFFINLFFLSHKGEEGLLDVLFEIDPHHYNIPVESLTIPQADPSTKIGDLVELFDRFIPSDHPVVYDDFDHLFQFAPEVLSLGSLKLKLTEMILMVLNRAPYTGVPSDPEERVVFYDKLTNLLRHLVTALEDEKVDLDKAQSCLIDLARGAHHCGKRWLDESLAHYKLFYVETEKDIGFKDRFYNALHELRLQVIKELASNNTPFASSLTHTDTHFRFLLRYHRGIFDNLNAFNDQLGFEMNLDLLLILFDQTYTSTSTVSTVLSLINNPKQTREDHEKMDQEFKDFVEVALSQKIQTETNKLLMTIKNLIINGATLDDIKGVLLEKGIYTNKEKVQELLNRTVPQFYDYLKDEMKSITYHDMHDNLLHKDEEGNFKVDGYGKTFFRNAAALVLMVQNRVLTVRNP